MAVTTTGTCSVILRHMALEPDTTPRNMEVITLVMQDIPTTEDIRPKVILRQFTRPQGTRPRLIMVLLTQVMEWEDI
ncbi:hypothetical protein ABTG41_04605 [Acinetobacter baumannii]